MAFGISSLFKSDSKSTSPKAGVIGVDIGSSAIKVVQIKDVKGVPTLETYGELQLGPYEGVDVGRTTRLTEQKSIEALVDILREAGATGKDTVFSLSYNSSFVTVISIPTLDSEKIGTMIPVEARKYIPISLTKVTLNWIPLGTNKTDKTTLVFLSAIYNDAFTRYGSIIKGSGLTIIGSEIEISACVRACVNPKDERVAVIDCGASSTRLFIVEKGVVKKTHSTLLSGLDLTKALNETLSMEFKEAEELKRTVGLVGSAGEPRIQKALAQVLERGLRELHTVIKRYEEVDNVPVQKIILSGSGALLQGLVPYMSDMFSRPVTVAQPFANIAYPAFLEDVLKEAGPSFSVAIGVALSAFRNK